MAARDFGQRAAPRQQRDADAGLDRALDPVEARKRDLNVDRGLLALVGPEHAVACWRRIAVRDDHLAADFLEVSADDVVFDPAEGRFQVVGAPQRSLAWAELAAQAKESGSLASRLANLRSRAGSFIIAATFAFITACTSNRSTWPEIRSVIAGPAPR